MKTKFTLVIFAAAIISATSLKIYENEEKRQMNYKYSSSSVVEPKTSEINQKAYNRQLNVQKTGHNLDFMQKIENDEVNRNYAVNSFIDPRNVPCPDEGDISPCTCTFDESYNTVMDCSNVTTEEKLREIFEKPFPFPDMYKFYMSQYNLDSNITELLNGIFNTKTFIYIEIRYVNFGFNFDIFDGMTSTLEEIYLYSVPLTTFIKDFSAYTQLDSIYTIHVPIEDVLIISPTLTYLHIYYSLLTERNAGENLKLGIMENLDFLGVLYSSLSLIPDISGYMSLAYLYVNANNIIALNTSMIQSLITFNAENNLIPDIDIGSIKVVKGGEVWMYSNQLQYLCEEEWKEIFINSSLVAIYNNPLLCGCDIAWMFGSDPDGILFMDKFISPEDTKCHSGELLTELDPELYQQMCS